jgi:hypothetical protein
VSGIRNNNGCDILIHAVSLALQLSSCVTIHNQCLNTKLISPIYFGNGAVCPKLSDQLIDIGTKMDASFEINVTQYDFEGVLLFKLQRYSDNQHNMNITTTENDRNETKCIQMFVAWKAKDSKPFAHIVLVEHTKEVTWNEDQLKKLYYENCRWLKEYDSTTSYTWFIDNNMSLKTSFRIGYSKGNFELSIHISEERDDYAMRPFCINLER